MQLQTQSAVRAVQGSLGSMSEDTEKRARLAAAVYLAQLAEQVRSGDIIHFEVKWDGDDLDVDVTPREYVEVVWKGD